MGHVKPELLSDLKNELNHVRELEGIREKGFGIFYLKSVPFLHFHEKSGKRWADVKTAKGWQQVDIEFKAGAKEKAKFLKSIKGAYLDFTARKRPK